MLPLRPCLHLLQVHNNILYSVQCTIHRIMQLLQQPPLQLLSPRDDIHHTMVITLLLQRQRQRRRRRSRGLLQINLMTAKRIRATSQVRVTLATITPPKPFFRHHQALLHHCRREQQRVHQFSKRPPNQKLLL